MHATDAEDTIRAIERVRRDTRRALHPLWFPNGVVAVFFLGATLIAGVVVVHRLTDGSFGEVAWVYPVAAGWLGFAAVFRDAAMAAAAVALIAIGTAIVAIEPADAWFWAQLTMALLLLAAVLVERAWERA